MTMQETIAPAPGTPVYRTSLYGDSIGWVAEVRPIVGNVFTLGAGQMTRQNFELVIVFQNLTETVVSEGTAGDWLEKAARRLLPAISAADVADRLQLARARTAEGQAKRRAESDAAAVAWLEFRDKYRDKIPADAKAVLVAELMRDESDSMTDYFNSTVTKTVILAFSTHTRDLFSEMRKAARNFAETAELADAPEKAEHREKYSMGSGYYLSMNGAYSSGWRVKKRPLYLAPGQNDRAASLPFGEWAVPETETETPAPRTSRPSAAPESPQAAPEAQTVNGFRISIHTHTKKGFQMAIVETPERVTSDQFSGRMELARRSRGWYSRAWGGAPAGFAFKDLSAAVKFAESL